ncbi:MAG: signal peptidase I [Clostridiales Family XIII bacterium]|jgi:signal peptidase|nr:signal peptidase I [Clostridiales Family XIII bacterium]
MNEQCPIAAGATVVSAPDRHNRKNRKDGPLARVFSALFYLLLIAAVLTVFMANGSDRNPRSIFGFSSFVVLTDSMYPVLPQGTFLLVHHVDAEEINIGDDITFMLPSNSTATHRVVDVYEGYGVNGERGFRTQGVNNPHADPDAVFAGNVVGRVVFSSPAIGAFIGLVQKRPLASAALGVMIFALFLTLRYLLGTLAGKVPRPEPPRSV